MDKVSPGRKLILDLLAKSVAKIQAESAEAIDKKKKGDDASAEAINMNGKDNTVTGMGKSQKKRKSAFEIPKPRKKMKAVHEKRDSLNIGNEKKESIEEDSFMVKPESKSLPVKHLPIKMKSESLDFDEKDKKRKTKKKKKLTKKVEMGTGIEMNKHLLQSAVKAEIQENQMIGQKGKPVKRKIKSEIEEISQEESVDAKNKIKREYTECKIEEVDPGYIGSGAKVFKKEHMEDSTEMENKLDVKTSSETVLEKFNLEHHFEHIKEVKNYKQKHSVARKNIIERQYKNRPMGIKNKKFTPEEDEVLIGAIEKSGDKLDINQLASELDRANSSIRARIEKLKTGKTGKGRRTVFTLEEDIFIIRAVLKYLNDHSLETLHLSVLEWKEISDHIGRGTHYTVRGRWDLTLKPWILQHYAGTFGMDVRRPLANYLADNYNDVNSIDWHSVACLPDFVGHTRENLKHIIFISLIVCTQNKLNISRQEITPRMIADVANTVYLPGTRVVLEKNVKRQKEIVEYFETYVKRNSITNFLRK